jgi:transcriptional regulator with GAF, ATPase, and Fis domain
MTSLPAQVIAIEKRGDHYQVIVQISSKYRGSFNTLAFGDIKPQDLAKKVQEGVFRQDLYFRLNVLNIRLPALRERGSDILLLAEHFLRRSASSPKSLSAAAAKRLLEHLWPGNVRELENVIRSSSLAVRGAVAVHPQKTVDCRGL